MKRILFFSAIVIALLMSSCSSDDYKSYIPGGSKMIGKIDLQQFVAQTGVDQEKLKKDCMEQLGEDMKSVEDMGIDLTVPIYFFADGKGVNYSFGFIAKTEDAAKFKKWFESQAKDNKLVDESGFSYFAEDEAGVAVNDDVVILFSSTDRDKAVLKRNISKIMNKEGDEKPIAENALFNTVEGNASFASFYIDMSIIPSEIMQSSVVGSSMSFEDMKKMVIGIDSEAKNGICDFLISAKSDDKAVQGKIDKMVKAFGKISDKALDTFSADDMAGFAMNTDGAQIIEMLKEAAGDNDDMKQMIDMFSDALNKIRGNVLARFDGAQYLVAAEGQNATSELNSLMGQMGDAPFNWGYNNGFMLFTPREVTIENPLQPASNKISSDLTNLMKNRREVIFVNVDKLSGFTSQLDGDAKKASIAFAEVLDKVKFITISYK